MHTLSHTRAHTPRPQVAGESAYTSAQFHPDGLILATGAADKVVRIWELRGQKNVAQFEGHAAPVSPPGARSSGAARRGRQAGAAGATRV